MKKIILVLILISFMPLAVAEPVQISSSYRGIEREINSMQYQIKKDKRQIYKIQMSKYLSDTEKKRRIKRLENRIYQQKRELSKIRRAAM